MHHLISLTIVQIQGPLTCTWPTIPSSAPTRCVFPTYVYTSLPPPQNCNNSTSRPHIYAESLGTRTANMMQLLHHYNNLGAPGVCIPGKDQQQYARARMASLTVFV